MTSRLTWFVDRSLGKGVAAALRAIGEDTIHHDEKFVQDEADDVWLPACAEAGWVVLTKDKAIRRRLNERAAHVSAGGRAFFLTSGTMTGEEMAKTFVTHISRMRAIAIDEPAPFLALVSRTNVVVHRHKPKRHE